MSATSAMTLDDFDVDTFAADARTKTVYRAGSGPGVLFMHEVPGITPTNIAFAARLVEAGFTVAMPDLLGDAGRPLSVGYLARSSLTLCVSREFQAFARKSDRPIIRWLRALGRDLHERTGGPIGAVGMCMTGGFALGLAVDDHVLAPVLSQPSLPVGVSKAHARDLGVPDAAAATVAARCADEGLCLLGLRFDADRLAPAARFVAMKERFGEAFEAITLDAGEWEATVADLPAAQRPVGSPGPPHSVLGGDYVDGPPTRAALDRVLEFFTERLSDGYGEVG